MRKALFMCLCVLGVVLYLGALTSCAAISDDPIVGTWSAGGLSTFTFKSNGTFTWSVVASPTISGNYTLNTGASTLHLSVSGIGLADFSYSFGPGNATLTLTPLPPASGATITYIRQ
jgi:hypothetical protein